MFVQRNFLYIVMVLATVFAVLMGATVYQKGPATPPAPGLAETAPFQSYWLGGQEETNTYCLESTRGRERMTGQATLLTKAIYFRTDEQVETTSEADSQRAILVLKASLLRRSERDTPAYSLETTVFTPINNPKFPNTLRLSTSEQTGEGPGYWQLNYRQNGYAVAGRTSTEQTDYTVAKALLEDELWTRIRLGPAQLPTGIIHLIPGVSALSNTHQPPQVVSATATLDSARGIDWAHTHAPTAKPGAIQAYRVDYETGGRKLLLLFETTFPHTIVGWEETDRTGRQVLTTHAILQKKGSSVYSPSTVSTSK